MRHKKIRTFLRSQPKQVQYQSKGKRRKLALPRSSRHTGKFRRQNDRFGSSPGERIRPLKFLLGTLGIPSAGQGMARWNQQAPAGGEAVASGRCLACGSKPHREDAEPRVGASRHVIHQSVRSARSGNCPCTLLSGESAKQGGTSTLR